MRLAQSCFFLVLLVAPALFAQGQPQDKPKWAPSPHIAATEPLRPEAQVKTFHLPPGFEMQLVAADPDIRKPINIAFDAAGRLWVTETVEYPYAAPPGKGRDALKVLEDFGPDGRARKITTFAGGLNIPIGVLPLTKRDALVYSIGSILALSDTKGDGKADVRNVLFRGYGSQDTHGMTGEFVRGFDGWVYACHGFSNTSTVKNAAGTASITMTSGNTYRFKPDGSQIEYFTHGQVNPFGICFDPLGNLYSADCHTRPLYQLLRGAWYPSFGRPDDGLGYGPEMVTHDHGSTAIAGINFYAADQYPEEFRGNLFVGNVVTNRINRDRLEQHGSTYKGIEMPDFVKCDDPWFRPVDIKLGPDGCLYIADFYNRIIGHYEVPLNHPGRDRDKGRIWRIVYRGADGKGVPKPHRDLTKLDVAGLVKELDSSNLTVRLQATQELVRHGAASVAPARAVLGNGSAVQKVHALWVMQRLGKLDDTALTAACKEQAPIVRVHAQRVLTERAMLGAEEHTLAIAGLNDRDALVQRCAAEALGAHPHADNVAHLLDLRHTVPVADTHLLHAVRMALRDQLRLPAAWQGLGERSEKDQRAIADVCPGVQTAQAAQFLVTYLQRFGGTRDEFRRYVHAAVRYGEPAPVVQAIELLRSRFKGDLSAEGDLLKTVQQASQERGLILGADARGLAETLVRDLLGSADAKHVQTGIELSGSFKLANAQPALLELARNAKAPEALRKNAVTTAVGIAPAKAVQALGTVLLAENEPIAVREQVASALAGTNQPEAHAALLKALESAPARLQAVIALGMAGSPQGGQKLLEAVGKGKASPRLLQGRAVELKLRQAKIGDLDSRLAKLTKGLPAADQRLDTLIARRRAAFLASKADPTVGAKVFEKHCAACHQVASKGAKIGPQLDGLGIRGPERILEDVLDPNRNVDQAFRATTLLLDDGQFISGLVLREEGQVIVLADAQGKEQRIPKASVQERVVSQLSPMPSNFAEQLNATELNDLVAYLLAQRAKE